MPNEKDFDINKFRQVVKDLLREESSKDDVLDAMENFENIDNEKKKEEIDKIVEEIYRSKDFPNINEKSIESFKSFGLLSDALGKLDDKKEERDFIDSFFSGEEMDDIAIEEATHKWNIDWEKEIKNNGTVVDSTKIDKLIELGYLDKDEKDLNDPNDVERILSGEIDDPDEIKQIMDEAGLSPFMLYRYMKEFSMVNTPKEVEQRLIEQGFLEEDPDALDRHLINQKDETQFADDEANESKDGPKEK